MTDPSPATPPPPTVVEAILSARSRPAFDPDRPIADDLLVRLLGLATSAPSSENLQPWRFVVVRSSRNRRRLRACAYNQPRVTEAPTVAIVLGYLNSATTDLEAMIAGRIESGGISPEAAAEVRGRVSARFAGRADLATWSLRSTMIGATTLILAAEGLGLASALIDHFDEAKLREAFGVPADHVVACLVALGHPTARGPSPGRFPLDRVAYQEHFGQPWTLGEPPDSP